MQNKHTEGGALLQQLAKFGMNEEDKVGSFPPRYQRGGERESDLVFLPQGGGVQARGFDTASRASSSIRIRSDIRHAL